MSILIPFLAVFFLSILSILYVIFLGIKYWITSTNPFDEFKD